MSVVVLRGDAAHLPLPDGSVDAIVCDPPYGLEFMGKEWDAPWKPEGRGGNTSGMMPTGYTDGAKRLQRPSFLGSPNPTCRNCGGCQRGREGRAIRKCVCDQPDFPNVVLPRMRAFQEWCEAWAAECFRVLKPGGYLLAFGGTRTWHRLVCGIEDAGFEVRDAVADLTGYDAPGLMWVYGSGFPKSLDVSKAIDKRAEENIETRRRITTVAEVIRSHREARGMTPQQVSMAVVGTPSGACWNWEHQQLPSVEMWPAIKAALGIADEYDALIEGDRPQFIAAERAVVGQRTTGIGTGRGSVTVITDGENRDVTAPATEYAARWEGWGTALKPGWEPIAVARKPLAGTVAANVLQHGTGALNVAACAVTQADSGSTDRWPPNVALSSAAGAELDRQSGMAASRIFPVFRYEAKADAAERPRLPDGTAWPTVKPVALIQWLVRLVTPPGGVVLDCFSGTGTTGEACAIEGFSCILLDRDPQALALTKVRLAKMIQPGLFRPGDSAPAAPCHRPVAASRPKPAPEVHPSLFDLEAS